MSATASIIAPSQYVLSVIRDFLIFKTRSNFPKIIILGAETPDYLKGMLLRSLSVNFWKEMLVYSCDT